jgi:hypothetical protein
MSDIDNHSDPANPMHHPDEQPTGTEREPRFGRLLLVLAAAVAFCGFIVWASLAVVGG